MTDRPAKRPRDERDDEASETAGETLKDVKHTPPNDESPNRVWDGTRVRARDDDDE